MANIDIRVGKKDAVFFSANPTLILKDGQFLFNSDTLELFIGDGTSQLSALVAINVPPSSGVQSVTGPQVDNTDPTNPVIIPQRILTSPDGLSGIESANSIAALLASDGTNFSRIDVYPTEIQITESSISTNTPLMVNYSKSIKSLTAAVWGAFINSLSIKATPVNADSIHISDSAASNTAKKLTLTNFKAFLKTYFDAIYTTTSAVATQISTALSGYLTTIASNNLDKDKNNFRLSLTSGLSVTTSDVVNAQTIYCTPHNGNVISLFDGTNWVLYESNEFSLALGTLATGNYDVFCYANAGVPTLEFTAWTDDVTRVATTKLNGITVKTSDNTRRLLGSFRNAGNVSSTVTISNGTPCTITWTGNPVINNMPVVFSTTGSLPSGLVAGTTYYVASLGLIDTNTFNVSATPGGALINTTTVGSGTHTCTVPTYTEDSQLNRFLSNVDNQVIRKLYRVEATSQWNYTTATYRQSNANRANQFNFIQCTDEVVFVTTQQRVRAAANNQVIPAIGLDTTTSASSLYPMNLPLNHINLANVLFIDYTGIGSHYIAALEYSTASGTTTWYAFVMRGEILG